MSRYTDLANQLYQVQKGRGQVIYKDRFIELKAMTAFAPDAVSINTATGDLLWYGKKAVAPWVESGPYVWAATSGFRMLGPTGFTGTVPTGIITWVSTPTVSQSQASAAWSPGEAAPAIWLKDWSLDQISPYLPAYYVELLGALQNLYKTRIFGRGILTPAEEDGVNKLLLSGVSVWMLTADQLYSARKDPWAQWMQANPRSPEFYEVAKAFAPALGSFSRSLINQAKVDIAAAQSDVSFWNAAYAVAEAVSQLPASIITAASTVATDAAGAAIEGLWPLALLAGAGYLIYNQATARRS